MKKRISRNDVGNAPTGNEYQDVQFAFGISLLAWPLMYIFNNGFENLHEDTRTFWMLMTGAALLAAITTLGAKMTRVSDWLYYGFILFTFTCVIDLIIGLEYNGIISGFFSVYLNIGEPYLNSPWGSGISLFDGIGFYWMYLIIIYQISNGKSWRSTGIYWGSGILNSMVVLIFGVFAGKHTPTLCILFNIPYVLLPIAAMVRAFGTEKREDWNQTASSGFLMKIFDLLLAFGLLASIWFILGKFLLAFGSEFGFLLNFLKHEPAILFDDPAPFNRIQSSVFLFYILPIQVVSLLYIFQSRKPQFLWEMSLVQAGAMMQGQFTVIYTALDPQTPKDFQSSSRDLYFWVPNLILLIIPQLFILRLLPHRKSSVRHLAKKTF